MTDRGSQDGEYVVVRDRKPKNKTRYIYYEDDDDDDDDDDNESAPATNTRRVIKKEPIKEQIKYVTADELESERRQHRMTESVDRRIKVRNTVEGNKLLVDEDGNILKIIQERTPSPPVIRPRRVKARGREHRTMYYETPDGHLIARAQKSNIITKKQNEVIYSEEDPPKVVRAVIIDPKTIDQRVIYEKDKPEKHTAQKYVVQKQSVGTSTDITGDSEQAHYVQVVRQTAPTEIITDQESPTKYVMIRKKVDSEPIYAIESSIPVTKKERRVVYTTSPKKSTVKYVYATNGKYYK